MVPFLAWRQLVGVCLMECLLFMIAFFLKSEMGGGLHWVAV